MRRRVPIDGEQLNRRLMPMGTDVDRYESQLIPDLNGRVRDLTVALEGLVAASADASPANLREALARARRALDAAGREPGTSAPPQNGVDRTTYWTISRSIALPDHPRKGGHGRR